MPKKIILLLLFITIYKVSYTDVAMAVELTMYSSPIESPYIASSVRAWEKKTGNKVTMFTGPANSSNVLALYRQQLDKGSHEVDLYEVELTWAGILGNHFIDLKSYSKGIEKSHSPKAIDSYTFNNRLVAMPLYLDIGVIYYRKDLLAKYAQPIPQTWQELVTSAKIIMNAEHKAGNKNLWGLVFQGKAYEGLTCCAIEWLHSFGGGTIIDNAGEVTVNNPNAIAALAEVASWIGTIVPKAVLNYSEEEARGAFQSGNAVFMRGWPYAWVLSQSPSSPIKDKVGIMEIPSGNSLGKSGGVIGGWGIAVSRYSKNQEAATDLLLYLTSNESQKKLALVSSYTPSIIELLQDPEIEKKNPLAITDILNNSVSRPSNITGGKYSLVSRSFYLAVHSVLSGKSTPEIALKNLDSSLKKIGKDGWR